MRKFTIVPFRLEDSEYWDSNIQDSCNYTFMGTRKFLSYHKLRFEDRSLSVFCDEAWVASLPAAVDPKDSTAIISYPGATFGGLYFNKSLRSGDHSAVIKQIINYYKDMGYRKLTLRPVPTFYRNTPIEDDYYALSANGAQIDFCRPTCTIPLQTWGNLSVTKGRKSTKNKASAAGVEVLSGWHWLDGFWKTLEDNLMDLHQATPVHTLEEMKLLVDRFKDSMSLYVGVKDSRVLAGALCFVHQRVIHTQYMSNTPQGREYSVLDAVIHHAVKKASQDGFSYFDFGTSQKSDGSIDEALYFYKQSFAAGSFCQWSFTCQL